MVFLHVRRVCNCNYFLTALRTVSSASHQVEPQQSRTASELRHLLHRPMAERSYMHVAA